MKTTRTTRTLLAAALSAAAMLATGAAHAGNWIYNPIENTIRHGDTPWVLNVTANANKELTIQSVFTRATSASALPLGDAVVGYTITAIAGATSAEAGVFYGSGLSTPGRYITSLTLPATLKTIGDYAFHRCSFIYGTLTIPAGVTSIGDRAFSYCTGLSGLTIPGTVSSIGHSAFYYCTGLTGTLTIGAGVTSIGDNAFGYCTSLSAFAVGTGNTTFKADGGVLFNPAGTTLIQYPAGKTGTTYTIPSNVNAIGDRAFVGCTKLTGTLTVPAGVTYVGGYAFQECTGLTRVDFQGLCPATGWDIFAYTSDSLTVYVYAARAHFWDADTANLSGSGTVAGGNATWNFRPIKTMSGTPPALSPMWVFNGTASSGTLIHSIHNWTLNVTRSGDNLTVTSNSARPASPAPLPLDDAILGGGGSLRITAIGDSAFRNLANLSSVAMPDSVTSIGGSAFMSCAGLTGTLTLGAGVTSIGDYAFDYSPKLSAFAVRAGNTAFKADGGVLFNLAGTTLVRYPPAKTGTTYAIPSTVNAIGAGAFSGCAMLTGTLTVPAGITTVGAYAFEDCINLTRVDFQGSCPTTGAVIFYNTSASLTVYVPAANASSWNADTANIGGSGTVAGGTATWHGKNIRLMPPPAPTGLTASNGTYTDRVALSWNASSGATSYKLYRSTTTDSASVLTTGITGTSYSDTTATAGTTYYYWVVAANTGGDSGYSSMATGRRATTTGTVPAAPTGLTASNGTHTDRVALTWNASGGAASYKVYRGTAANPTTLLTTTTGTTHNDTTATPGATYHYRVQATNAAGDSPYSANATGMRATTGGPVSAPYLSDAALAPIPAPIVTTAYDGFLYDAGGSTVLGTLTLTAKATVKADKKAGTAATNWTYTAKATLQTGSVSFKGAGTADSFAATATGGEKLALTVNSRRIYGAVSGGKAGGTLHADGARNAFADKKDKAAQDYLAKLKGYHTAALIGAADGTAAGYLTLTVGNAGSVKLAGILADGTKVSGSAKLLDGLNEAGWLCAALHKPLYSKKGSIGGLLWLDPAGGVLRTDTACAWYIDWVDAAATVRPLDICGGLYSPAAILPRNYFFSAAIPALPAPVAGLDAGADWMSTAYPDGIEAAFAAGKFTLPKADTLKKPAKTDPQKYDYISGPNPSGAKLGYTAKTGIFKGSFKLYYDGTKGGVIQHKAVTANYTGVLTPKRDTFYKDWPLGLGTGTVKIGAGKVGIAVELE